MSTPEVIIVGAGAAGIGAGMALQARGIPFVILEAAGRIGGRAYTDSTTLGVPWDHGCHWMHCADQNPLVPWADRVGAIYLKEAREDYLAIWHAGRFLGDAEVAEGDAAVEAAFAAIDAAGAAGRDVPVTDVMPDTGRWEAGVRCVLALMAGEDPQHVSAEGYADYAETDMNWPVLSGYGAMIAKMAEGLPIRTGTRVTAIEQRSDGARVVTSDGTLEARGVIVTASTNVIASGAIRFHPGAARDVARQLHRVPCGAYEKVAFALREMPTELRGKIFLNADPGDGTGAVSFQMVEHGDTPLIIAHFAGTLARTASEGGADALTDFASDRLRAMFGGDVDSAVLARAPTNWTQNAFVQGSYSHAEPGAAQLRRDLIEADTGSVAFAGEAFSRQWQATAHGAWTSGQDVARRMADRLKRETPGSA